MKLRVLFRAVRIAVLASLFALLLGECLAPGITGKIFNSGHESSQQSPRKPGNQLVPVRA